MLFKICFEEQMINLPGGPFTFSDINEIVFTFMKWMNWIIPITGITSWGTVLKGNL